ncbi:hypothetical protein [Marinicellulosiphila megalodicopiae]|uniref:hypothetical protein n=1 Tax=Marinicellulosiphila megalodicopiae TaxID=2724896 RepID=UPI003BB09823
MSRTKKTRSLKTVNSVKTGSKSQILDNDGNRGKIPSKNKLSKHKNKPLSAYAKSLLAQGKKDESSGNAKKQPTEAKIVEENIKQPIKNAQQKSDQKPEKKSNKDFKDLDGDELLDYFDNF